MRDQKWFEERCDKIETLDALENKDEPWIASAPITGPCWIWKLSVDGNGRPAYCDRSAASYNQSATRGLWRVMRNPELTNPKVFLCHNCPNIRCINPDHLYEGDAKANRNDEVARRRINAPKIDDNVDEIVRLFKDGVEQQEIAKKIGVCSGTIMRFLNGLMNKYRHNYVKEAEEQRNALIKRLFEEGKSLTQIMNEARTTTSVIHSVIPEIRNAPKGKAIHSALAPEERDAQIRAERNAGKSVREIAVKYGISIPLVYHICKKDTPLSLSDL